MARLFTLASDETLGSMISTATDRLVIVAPGLSREVASALADRINKDGGPRLLAVILDVDPEVCRLGYGDVEAFDLLRPALELRGLALQTQKGVRVGLVVADSEVLVYSPTPKLIEAGSKSEEKPNAIRITENGAEDLAIACGAVEAEVPAQGQEVGLDVASERVIEETKADLKENPPRQFDLARLERVFNYKLEFVEFSISHYKLNTRSVPLSAALLGLTDANLQQRFHNTFRVFQAGAPFRFKVEDPTDVQQQIELTEKWLSDQADELRKDYFIPLGSSSYGNLIQKRRKPEFEAKVARLKKLVELYATKVREAIGEKIGETRAELIKALLPRVKAAPPPTWLQRSVDGQLGDETILARLENEIDGAFKTVKQTFSPTITCLFKGVNYATITKDPHFREKIEAYFGADEAKKLFEEYEASKGTEADSIANASS